jgi:ubiquinone/menaquinone biosynthesis C-methylase UbiE
VLLRHAGHRVVAADFAPGRMVQTELAVVTLNLHAPLPFRDATFDAVIGIEGIEHLENPYLPAREFFRVLRPGACSFFRPPIFSTSDPA